MIAVIFVLDDRNLIFFNHVDALCLPIKIPSILGSPLFSANLGELHSTFVGNIQPESKYAGKPCFQAENDCFPLCKLEYYYY